jgi:nitrogen fixation/metabolism regulation signal transduction histidine kinase
MNSLRTRLILGFSLVALVPLALAMLLLGTRIQRTVHDQAAARLAAALNVLRGELENDGERLQARLALIARDPQLKRMFLVGSADDLELRQYLADQRFLIGLDYLAVADSAGRLRADAATAPAARTLSARAALGAEMLPVLPDSGLAVVSVTSLRALALDARAAIPYQDTTVGFVRGGMLLDALFLKRLQRASGLELVLRDGSGRVLATTLQGGDAGVVLKGGAKLPGASDTAAVRVVFAGRSYLMRDAVLGIGSGQAARLTAFASTATADDALAVLRSTSLALGLLGLLLAVLLGGMWSHQLSRPVERLADFSDRISRGEWDEPLELVSMRELQTLVRALERMRGDLGAYRDKLRTSERQAAYGQMARKVAHEIKNPLTPIAVSVAGLQRAYDQQQPDFGSTLAEAVRTVGEEVLRLKMLLQEFSDLGRFPSPRPLRFDMGDLFVDLRTMYAHEVAARRLAFEWPSTPLMITADRDQLRQAIINLLQNALDATAEKFGHVWVEALAQAGALWLVIRDDGPGLSEEQRAQLFVPGFTTKAHGSGLGLTIVERIVSDHGGSIEVHSVPDEGTTFAIHLALDSGA